MSRTKRRKYPVSLVARAGLVMAIIVSLALASLLSSMFVSESLDGDAAQINIAGSLRMQTVKVSLAVLTEQFNIPVNKKVSAAEEISVFDEKLNKLIAHGLIRNERELGVELINRSIEEQWSIIKKMVNRSPDSFKQDTVIFNNLVNSIDNLVTQLQRSSEKKIRLLRVIQGTTLFSTLLIAFIAIFSINRTIVQPMNQLVSAAKAAGKGDFHQKLNSQSDDEIGLLSATFNQMSEQLQLMHNQFEQKVLEKTAALEQSNKSLSLLYKTSHSLVKSDKLSDFQALLNEVENSLGDGEIVLCLDSKADNQIIPISSHPVPKDCDKSLCETCTKPDFYRHHFDLKKHEEDFGHLRFFSTEPKLPNWKAHLLQSIADNLAVAISLEKKRNQKNLLVLFEERAVIARELHDSLAQSLSYLKVQTSLLSRQIEKGIDVNLIENTTNDLKNGLNDAYRQLRELLTTFRLKIEEPSLESALKGTVAEFSTKCGIPIELKFDILNESLPPNQQIHVLQIIREALSNVYRHAQATKVVIKIETRGENIIVQVIDDGVGLAKEKSKESHYGLSIMRERAESLNARFEINNNQPHGVIVEFEFRNKNRSET